MIVKVQKHLHLAIDGTLKAIEVTTPKGLMLSVDMDYSSNDDVVLAVFARAVVLFGITDHSDHLRRSGLIKIALQYYAETHNDELLHWVDGELVIGGHRHHYLPLKRGIYITIGKRWVFTYRPDIHVKKGLVLGTDSFAPKVAGIDASKEAINFEQLLTECQHLRGFK